MHKDPKQTVMEIVQMVGRPEAERLLISEKLSPSLATKLVRGLYESQVRALVADAIERAKEAAKAQAS